MDGGDSSKAETTPGSGVLKKEDTSKYPNKNEFCEDKRQDPIQKSEGTGQVLPALLTRAILR